MGPHTGFLIRVGAGAPHVGQAHGSVEVRDDGRVVAGRVQSVAVRLIADRERQIEDFKPQEYWTIEADLAKPGQRAKRDVFRAQLVQRGGKKVSLKNEAESKDVLAALQGAAYAVVDVRTKRNHEVGFRLVGGYVMKDGRRLGTMRSRSSDDVSRRTTRRPVPSRKRSTAPSSPVKTVNDGMPR